MGRVFDGAAAACVALLVGALGAAVPASGVPVAEPKAKPSLKVTVKGLPKGTAAAVTVKGPDRFKKKLTGTSTLKQLAPGTYKVVAKAVAGGTVKPAKPKQTVTVASGQAAVTVKYVRQTTPPPPPPPPTGGPEITTTSLPSGMVGADYFASLSRTQGGVPFDEGSWSWTAATAPPGLAMDEMNGAIWGRPTAAGTYTFTVTFASGKRSGSRNLTIVVAPPPAAQTWKMVSAGIATRCGIKTDDTAWCWGLGMYGDLGNGASGNGADSFLPVPVAGGGTWKTLDVGGYTCGIKSDDTAWCWGWNFYGTLGDGTTTDASVPVQVSGGDTWAAVDAGYAKSCGIKTDGTAWCWGAGQLGDGAEEPGGLVPVQVLGGDDWETITVGTPGGQAGSDHTCATKSDGSAWCWGEGYYGALGIGEVQPGDTVRTEPTAVDSTEDWQLLVGGARHTCGIADDAALWCWGRYNNGQLGTSLLQSHYSPDVVVEDGPWRMVGPGELHTCGTKVDNTGWCWGSNGWKQLGPATSAAESLVPLQVPGSWASLDAGDFATCGVRTDGKAFCWGKSFNGGLGDVSTTDSATPVPVLG